MGRRRSGVAIALSVYAPVTSVDAINERVAFIKINKMFPLCVSQSGEVNQNHIKEVARGIWSSRCVPHRANVEYLFAIFRGRVFGVYRVVGVSPLLPDAYNNGLKDFPGYPESIRECDRWKAQFATASVARQNLTHEEYQRFIASLSRPHTTPDCSLALDRKRFYFSVNDEVPDNLKQFLGCQIKYTSGLGGRILSNRCNPVICNF